MLKHESLILLGLGVFFGLMGIVYWMWGHEDGGGVMLLGAFLLGMLPGFYYLWWYRHSGHKYRTEDREEATIQEGAGIVDSFPSTSIWPFVLGLGCFSMVLALVFGAWFAVPAIGLMVAAFVGVTAESRRGGDV